MRAITLILIAIASFMLFFLVISAIGMLWENYLTIICSFSWFVAYTFIFGWLSIFPTREYYILHEEYFDTVFN